MARPKYTKPDKNQQEIVQELRALGFDVDIICDLPGLYDLVVCKDVCVRVEVKSEGRDLTADEFIYFCKQNHQDSYIVAHSAQDVIDWFT